MSERQGKKCESPGPHGQSCFLLEGHKGRHRIASVFEWSSGEPALNLTQQEAREAAAFRAMAENLWGFGSFANKIEVTDRDGDLVGIGAAALEAVEAAMAGQVKPVAKAKCGRCGGKKLSRSG